MNWPALLIVGGSLTVFGGDWPHFLGPTGNGVSGETGLVEKLSERGLPILWSKAVGTGYSAPSVSSGRLVLFHRTNNNELIECLNPADGNREWLYTYPTRYTDPYGYNNGPRCTPLLTTNRCFTFGAEGMLTCTDLKTGKVIWQRATDKEWEIPEAFFGVGSSPILDDGRLIVMIGGQPNSGVVALDPETGKTLWQNVGEKSWQGAPMLGWPGERTVEWRRYEKQASYASPVAATVHGHKLIFCLMRQGLVALDSATGEVKFRRWFRARVDESVNAMSPVVVDDSIFFSAAYYRVGSVFLRINPDLKSFDEVWKSTVLEIHWNTPIYFDGFLYGFSGRNEPDARFRCVELKTGKLQWDRDESWPAHSSPTPPVYGRGSAIMADKKLIVLGEGGLLGIFAVDPSKPLELGRWQVPQLQYPTWAAPVLSDKRLFLRGENRLICLDAARH